MGGCVKANRDEEGLRQLFELYGPGMKGSPLAATFDYIARPSDGVGFDASTIQKRIADVDQFQAFMKNYRERLLNSRVDSKPKAQTSRSEATPTHQADRFQLPKISCFVQARFTASYFAETLNQAANDEVPPVDKYEEDQLEGQ